MLHQQFFKVPQKGFTIVELLIVVVVIAILASITIVSYNGIQNRAHDTAVQSDLRNIANRFAMYRAENGELPSTNITLLGTLGLKVSTGSYSQGFISGGNGNNLIYCRADNGSDFALVAWSKSSQGFAFKDGSVTQFANTPATFSTTCPAVGITAPNSAYYSWLYAGGSWRI